MKNFKFWSAFFVFSISIFLVVDCKKKKKEDRSEEEKAGTLAVGYEIIDDLKVALTEKGLQQEQVDTISAGALAGLQETVNETAALRLFTGNQLSKATRGVTSGAIGSLDEETAALEEDADKMEISELVVETVVKALSGKIENVDPLEKAVLPGDIANAAISSLDEAGLEDEYRIALAGALVGTVIGNLEDGGFIQDDFEMVFKNLGTGAIGALGDAGFAEDDLETALKTIMATSVASFEGLDFEAGDAGKYLGTFFEGSVAGLADCGYTSPGDINAIAGPMMFSAIAALDDAGFESKKDFAVLMGEAMQGAMAGIKEMGFGADGLGVLNGFVSGAVFAFDDPGMTDPAQMKYLSKNLAENAIGFLDEMGLEKAGEITDAAGFISEGMMTGLGKYRASGFLSAAELGEMISDVTEVSASALFEVTESYGYGADQFENIAGGFTGGIVAGLGWAGINTGEINAFNDEIAAGFQEGLANAEYSTADMNQIIAGVNTDFAQALEDAQNNCESNGGTWTEDIAVAGAYHCANENVDFSNNTQCEEIEDENACLTPCVWEENMCKNGVAGPSACSVTNCAACDEEQCLNNVPNCQMNASICEQASACNPANCTACTSSIQCVAPCIWSGGTNQCFQSPP